MANYKKASEPQQYDEKGNGAHWRAERVETVVLMEHAFGTVALTYFCEMNAFKYRLRAGKKKGQSIEQEIKKANWYERAAQYYLAKIDQGKALEGVDKGLTPSKLRAPW